MELPAPIQNKRLLVLFAIALAILAIFFAIYQSAKEPKPGEDISKKDPQVEQIAKLAPFNTDFMSVFYYPKVESFTVIVFPPFDQNKEKSLTWFGEHQIENLCQLKIEFRNADNSPLTSQQRNTPDCPSIY